MLADGLIDVPIPEEIPKDGFDDLQQAQPGKSSERPGMLGRPIAPSQGGWGEQKSELLQKVINENVDFRSQYEYLEEHWNEISPEVQNLAVKEIDEYLDNLLNVDEENVIIEE
jgi:hypothetical protein